MSDTALRTSVLRILKERAGQTSFEELLVATGSNHSALMKVLLQLSSEGIIRIDEKPRVIYRLTNEGQNYALAGLPERRLLQAVIENNGKLNLAEAASKVNFTESLANIALGWVVKKGWGKVEKENGKTIIKATTLPPESSEEFLLRLASKKAGLDSTELPEPQLQVLKTLAKRNLFEAKEATSRKIALLKQLEIYDEGPQLTTPSVISSLTSDILTTGKWRDFTFRKYDVTASPPVFHPGKKHYYVEFLEEVKRILISMGFEESTGPYVETEFWNFDVLFQAQDHPAREIHDSYLLKHPSRGTLLDDALVENVQKTHENGWTTGSKGWGYKWSFDIARRLVLRTQTTAVSMRFLWTHREPPVKMFCLSRVFRPDVLDNKHSMEFNQCEGIVMDKGLNFCHLLGYLSDFANVLELGEVRFRPGYFPFTEPSVEAFAEHPKLGWMEFGGAGIFRPEVCKPLGIRYPVLAWGIGIDRIAMAKLGIDDIRDLFSNRLDFLRER